MKVQVLFAYTRLSLIKIQLVSLKKKNHLHGVESGIRVVF